MVYQSSSRSLLAFGRTMMPRPYVTRTGLEILPVELICMILENLEMPDLLNCQSVSKLIRRTIKESSRLKYTIELAKNRMISILPAACSPSFATRLRLLRTREDAWKYLNFKQRRVLNLPPTGSVYEFVGGLYGNGREDETRATASISFLELPSVDAAFLGKSQDELKVWTHTMDDVSTIDFTMDPAQDLLVLVTLAPLNSKYVYEVYLRSIKTNRPHPSAPNSVLHCLSSRAVQPLPSETVASVRVQVFGDLVALLIKEVFESPGAHLEIWNWVNGSYSCTMFQRSGIDDFTFLNQESFLLVRPGGKFEVYDFADPVKCHTIPILRVSYGFPTLSEDYIYWYIAMSSNPAPGYVPRCQKDDNVPDNGGCRQLYYPTPGDRIHACCIYILNPTNEENAIVHSFVFFVNLKTLLCPPPTWFNHHTPLRRRKARASRREALIDEASQSNLTVQSTGQSALSVPIYPPFPTFDSSSQTIAQISQPTNTTLTQASSASTNIGPNRGSSSHRNSITIPWKTWGPQSTRWFEECLSTDWQHAVYGSRTVESLRPEHHPWISRFLSTTNSSTNAENQDQPTAINSHDNDDDNTDGTDEDGDGDGTLEGGRPSSPERYLRIRNFNSFVFKDADLLKGADMLKREDLDPSSTEDLPSGPSSERAVREAQPRKTRWSKPRLITEPSVTPVKGVFTHDIVSWLPYTEVISSEKYEVTDVMMDDSRLLLLKRGRSGRLKRVEVLLT